MCAQHAQRPRLLIPRPAAQAETFAAEVEAAMPGEWDIVLAPLMEIRFADAAPDMTGVTDLIFSSANGVAAFAALCPGAAGLQAHCVGPRTTEAAAAAGFRAETAGRTAEELVERLARSAADPARRYLHLRGSHASADISGALAAAGHAASEAVVYDQVALPLPAAVARDLAEGGISAVTLFSPRSARLLLRAAGRRGIAPGTVLLCLSDAVARALPGAVLRVAPTPDAAGMLALLGKTARG